MHLYRFDMSLFPVVILTVEGDITQESLDRHFVEYRELFARGERYGLVYDTSKLGNVESFVRKRYAEFMLEHREELATLCVACGVVMTSRIIRVSMSAVLWMTGSLPFPTASFTDRPSAEAWVREQLAAG